MVLWEVDFVTTFCEPAVFATIEVVVLTAFQELRIGVREGTPFEAWKIEDVSIVAEG